MNSLNVRQADVGRGEECCDFVIACVKNDAVRDFPIGAVATAALFSLCRFLLSAHLVRSGVARSLVLLVPQIYYPVQTLFLEAGFTVVGVRRFGC